MDVSNPYAIIKLCDSFVLSSYYEGFGLVLAEADIVGLPVISTNITGPRGFMNKYGGTMVDNSQGGIEEGLKLLYDGKVPMLKTDYEQYNKEVVEEFEAMLKININQINKSDCFLKSGGNRFLLYIKEN